MDKIATRSAENGLNFKLREGYSAETSGNKTAVLVNKINLLIFYCTGGLMVVLPKDKARSFCEEIEV